MCTVEQIYKAFRDQTCPKCLWPAIGQFMTIKCTNDLCGWWATARDILEMIRQDDARFWAEHERHFGKGGGNK